MFDTLYSITITQGRSRVARGGIDLGGARQARP